MRTATTRFTSITTTMGILAMTLIVAFALAGCGKGKEPKDPNRKLKIAVIPKGTTHEFWKSIHAGAAKAAQELNVDIVWKGPQKEDDREQQIQVVKEFAFGDVDGIVLAPLDSKALVAPVKEAMKAEIPVVIIDSGLEAEVGKDFVSYIATDNYQGGVMGAKQMALEMEAQGNLVVLRCQEGSASTEQREKGFIDTITRYFPKIKIVSDNQYAGPTTETGMQAAQRLLSQFEDIQGFYAPNESSTFGALRALQDAGKAGQVKFVGFDSSEKLVQGMRDGQIQGLTVQNPMKMGYEGVKTMVAYLRGEQVQQKIDTGVEMVTPANMDKPEIQELLLPDFKKYLGD